MSQINDAMVDVTLLNNKEKRMQDPIEKVYRTFESGKTWDVAFRHKQLQQLLSMYEALEGEMLRALDGDMRKSKQEATILEIDFLKNDLRDILQHFRQWVKPETTYRRFMDIFGRPAVYRDAYGVVLIMGEWSYPFKSVLLPLAGAIAAGNCVVLKVPSMAANCYHFLKRHLHMYIDGGCYHLLDETYDDELLRNSRFDYVFFNGPAHEAKRIQMSCARHLTPSTLVLGGRNPVYLDESADMEMAARRILWGKCVNAGQMCIAPEYVLCTRNTQAQFLELVPKMLREFYGDDVQKSADYARLISKDHFLQTVALMRNKNVAYGGHHDLDTLYIEPTVLENVTPNDSIMHTEIFAPLLALITVKDVEEAVSIIKAREKPLAMYIFSRNKRQIEMLLTRTSAGGVTVNDTLLHAQGLPFGGVGNSGFGKFHGRESVETFSHRKSVLKKSLSRLFEIAEKLKYPPYNAIKLKIMTEVARKRRGQMNLIVFKYLIVFLLGTGFVFLVDVIKEFL